MRPPILATALLAASLTSTPLIPVFAESLSKPEIAQIYRDSDGNVISILYGPGGPAYEGPVYWRGGVFYEGSVDGTGGPILFAFGAVDDIGSLPDSVDVNGTELMVERTGDQVFLRDAATGQRFATKARRAPQDKSVNPTQFGLD